MSIYEFDEEAYKQAMRMEGMEQGIIKMGLNYGLSESDILEQLQSILNVSLAQAQECLAAFERQHI